MHGATIKIRTNIFLLCLTANIDNLFTL